MLLCQATMAAQHSGLVRSLDQPIPGATVTATQGGAHLTAVTDDAGQYAFELTPGLWRFEVEIFGFEKAVRELEIKDQFPTTIDWILQLKGGAEAAPAEAAAGFQTLDLAQTAEPAPDPVVEAHALEEPAGGANEAFLVSGSLSSGLQDAPAEPEVKLKNEAPRKRKGETGSTGLAGYTASGPRVEGFAGAPEGRGAKARAAGKGAGVKPAPKSARGRGRRRTATSFGNKRPDPGSIHGTAFLNLRNSALDARPYSLSGQDVRRPSYAQMRFGFSAGGQLRIPKVIESERTFFFFNYTGGRSRNPYDNTITVPSPAERGGDFSQSVSRWPVEIFDPASGLPFPGNRIPAARFNPASAGLLEYIPAPNLPGRVQNFQFGASIRQDMNNYGVRLNQGIGRRDRLSFNFNRSGRGSAHAQPYGFLDDSGGGGFTSSASYVHNFGPRRVLTVTWNFSRNRTELVPYFAYRRNVADELGIEGASDEPVNWGPPNLSFTNFGGLSDGASSLRRDQTSTLQGSMLFVRKGHNVTVGGEFRRAQLNSRVYQGARGSFSFSGLITSDFDAKGQPLPGTGFDFADFLLGFPQSSNLRFGSENTYFRSSIYGFYAQDDWRMRPGFTLNAGIRYEYFPPFTEKRDRIANLDIAPGFTGVAVVTPGQSGPYSGEFPRGLVDPDKNNISPRIGFAWRPSGKKSTQVRGGYSVFYNGAIYREFPSRMASQPPFARTAHLTTSNARRITVQNGFAPGPSSTINNTFAVDRDYQVGYAQTFSLSVQHSFPHQLVADVGYLGTKGTRLDVQRLPNRAAPGSPLTAEQRRQIGNAVGFTFDTSSGNSIYHALQVRFTRRFSGGIAGNLLYTWSKSIDNVSTYGGGGVVVAQNDKDLRAERGLSSFDARHAVTAGYTLASPVGDHGLLRGGGWKMRALANWTLSGAFTISSGTPLTARVLGNQANSGGTGVVGSGRADASGEPVAGGRFFNLAAFAIPPAGRFGNAGRNTIPGPSRFIANASFGRSFRMADTRRTIELRLEANNWLNHASYGGLSTVVNALTYGLPTSVLPMRSMQAVMRVRF